MWLNRRTSCSTNQAHTHTHNRAVSCPYFLELNIDVWPTPMYAHSVNLVAPIMVPSALKVFTLAKKHLLDDSVTSAHKSRPCCVQHTQTHSCMPIIDFFNRFESITNTPLQSFLLLSLLHSHSRRMSSTLATFDESAWVPIKFDRTRQLSTVLPPFFVCKIVECTS